MLHYDFAALIIARCTMVEHRGSHRLRTILRIFVYDYEEIEKENDTYFHFDVISLKDTLDISFDVMLINFYKR